MTYKFRINFIKAWLVHIFTCTGLIAGFLSLTYIFKNDQKSAFICLGIALIIDAIDGTLARKLNVSKYVENIDGKMLDSVIDFFNYIIIPSIMIFWFNIVPISFVILIPLIILIISAISYSNLNLMTSENFYKGFPCIWNILLLYLYFFDFNQIVNLIIISVCIVLKFIPIKYLHPLRVKKLKIYSIIFMILWFVSSFKILTTSFYIIENNFDLLFLSIWVISNIYFISLTFYEILFDIYKAISIKINNHEF